MTLYSKTEVVNEKFVTLCKVSNDTIRVDYLDSTHSLTNIDKDIKGDTLLLKINICLSKSHQYVDFKLSEGVKYISTGTVLYEIDKIEQCKKVYSGNEALEQLKKEKFD
jgi:hypothetical protein